jgi:hypothetical protein
LCIKLCPREALRSQKVPPSAGRFAGENFGGGVVDFGGKAPLFGRFAEIFVKPKGVMNGFAAGRVPFYVRGAVVTVRHDVQVQVAALVGGAVAYLCNREKRAAELSLEGVEHIFEQGAVEDACGAVAVAQAKVGGGQREQVRVTA